MISSKERGINMSRSRHSEAEMIAALKQVDAGRAVEDVAREVGVSKHTIYGWKAKYGGMDVSQAQEAKQLRLKREALRFHGFHEVRRIRFRLEGQTRSHCWLWLGHPLSSFLAQINYHCAVRLNPVIRHLLPLLDLRPPCPLCGPQFYAGQAATTNVRPQG